MAHPDDEALGIGGTLIKHTNSGDNVNILILSEGEDSKIDETSKNPDRLNNARGWAKFTECTLYEVLSFPDQKLDFLNNFHFQFLSTIFRFFHFDEISFHDLTFERCNV